MHPSSRVLYVRVVFCALPRGSDHLPVGEGLQARGLRARQRRHDLLQGVEARGELQQLREPPAVLSRLRQPPAEGEGLAVEEEEEGAA